MLALRGSGGSTAGDRSLTELGSAGEQNVAKTIGSTTFAKINHLWLQREGRPTNAAAATDDLFSQTPIKPMKY